MNQKTVNKIITELTRLKNEGKAITDPSTQALISNARSSFGICSDEFVIIAKAADRIFRTEADD